MMSEDPYLSIMDLVILRKMTSLIEAQSFLEHKGVPMDKWEGYTKYIGTITPKTSAIRVVAKDPLRHKLWAMLKLNGCSYRQIAQRFEVRHSSVLDAVRKHVDVITVSPVINAPIDTLIGTFQRHRDLFADTKQDIFVAAQLLSTLAMDET
jgi:hypothetical protein